MFGSLMGDFDDDPFFGSHMRSMQRMNSMMNSMFADPFGMMGAPALMDGRQQNNGMQQMMPFGGFPMMPVMPSIGQMFSNLQNMQGDPNCHSFSSSSVMTMTSGADGRPQIYQESMSTRVAPGGIKETKKTVSDSRSGLKKMAIGHHIGDRAHVLEREQNYISGEQEERQEFINLDEEEAESFNHEWEQKTKRSLGAIGSSNHRSQNYYNQDRNQMLALPSTHPSRPSETCTSNNQQAKNSSSSDKPNWNKHLETSQSKHCANSSINDVNDEDEDETNTIDLTKSPENLQSTTIDLTKSPEEDSHHNTSRKRSISPEIEEVEEPSNKRRLAAESD